MAKKSFYLFLTGILGMLLFLIMQRIIVFTYLYLLAAGYTTIAIDYYKYLSLDFITLVLSLLLGAWYGIWLGLYWFQKVYEEGSHGGFVHHLSQKIFFRKPKNLTEKISAVRSRLENDLGDLENLSSLVMPEAKPVKRRVIRRRVVKKT